MRAIPFVIISLMLGGCMQETLAPVSQAGWSVRDRQLMSNLPHAQATIPEEYRRHIVEYARQEAPGTIVVDSSNDVFVHISAVERAGLRSLNEGQTIEYEIESDRGRQSAANLRVR